MLCIDLWYDRFDGWLQQFDSHPSSDDSVESSNDFKCNNDVGGSGEVAFKNGVRGRLSEDDFLGMKLVMVLGTDCILECFKM